jgi:precorrin-6A/cobalt-precorrin-6A reductase
MWSRSWVARVVVVMCSAGRSQLGCPLDHQPTGVVSGDASVLTVLVLGGTSEARELAAELAGRPGLRVISSLAGRVRDPALPAGEVRIGGFGGAAGLAGWARAHNVDAVVDATHPFAETISAHAVAACAQAGLPLLRLTRPGWLEQPGDDWHHVGSLDEAAAILPSLGTRVFLTTGRQGLAAFAAPRPASLAALWFLIRCVDPPSGAMPANREVLLARGPYTPDAERALMRRFDINVLVTKNSGGSLTEGKLAAARDLGIPVVMIRRPAGPDAPSAAPEVASPVAVSTVAEAVSWVLGCAQAPEAQAPEAHAPGVHAPEAQAPAGRAPDRNGGA